MYQPSLFFILSTGGYFSVLAKNLNEFIAELLLPQLSCYCNGKIILEDHNFRDLVIGKLFLAEIYNILFRDLSGKLLLSSHNGNYALAPLALRVRNPYGNCHLNPGVPEDHVIQLGGIDLQAGNINHVLDPVGNVEKTLVVHVAQVPGMEPPVFSEPRRIGPVPLHYLRPLYYYLAGIPKRHILPRGRAHHPDLRIRHRDTKSAL